MKIPNLLMVLAFVFFVGMTIGCENENSTNAQGMDDDMETPGAEEASCPCNFDQDFWTSSGWMVVPGGGLFQS